jgi:hypothetical protein
MDYGIVTLKYNYPKIAEASTWLKKWKTTKKEQYNAETTALLARKL